jgi:hypothetical protein
MIITKNKLMGARAGNRESGQRSPPIIQVEADVILGHGSSGVRGMVRYRHNLYVMQNVKEKNQR